MLSTRLIPSVEDAQCSLHWAKSDQALYSCGNIRDCQSCQRWAQLVENAAIDLEMAQAQASDERRGRDVVWQTLSGRDE